jgi:hypothetical protein
MRLLSEVTVPDLHLGMKVRSKLNERTGTVTELSAIQRYGIDDPEIVIQWDDGSVLGHPDADTSCIWLSQGDNLEVIE